MPLEFTSGEGEPRPIRVVEFALDGEQYTAIPPKMTALIVPTRSNIESAVVTMQWFTSALNAGDRHNGWEPPTDDKGKPRDVDGPQAQRIAARLRDPDDPLLVSDIDKIVGGVIREAGGRPTSSSSD